jgi:hypothetical protein
MNDVVFSARTVYKCQGTPKKTSSETAYLHVSTLLNYKCTISIASPTKISCKVIRTPLHTTNTAKATQSSILASNKVLQVPRLEKCSHAC